MRRNIQSQSMWGVKMSDKQIIFSSDSGEKYKFVTEPEENDGRTVFSNGETARIKLYPGGSKPELQTTVGSCKITMEDLSQRVSEFIIFKDTNSAKTEFPIDRIISFTWEGSSGSTPVFKDRTVSLAKPHRGVLRVEYYTTYDLIDVTVNMSTYAILSASSDNFDGYHPIDFTYLSGSPDTGRQVILNVKDACTKKRLNNATVHINNRYAGKTDSRGRLRLGLMSMGRYSLKITKDGYKPTDSDSIRNDYFTVE